MKRIRLAGQPAEPISHNTGGVEDHGFLYSLGMLLMDAAGELVGPGDVIRQSEQVLNNVGALLPASGASFGDSRPASTLVEVSVLAHPDALVGIEAVASLADRDEPLSRQGGQPTLTCAAACRLILIRR
jgi:2-iminobutanoate/2-iminopropanoate deaminase